MYSVPCFWEESSDVWVWGGYLILPLKYLKEDGVDIFTFLLLLMWISKAEMEYNKKLQFKKR